MRDRLLWAGIGVLAIVVGVGLILVSFAAYNPNASGWDGVVAGTIDLVGFTLALAGLFLAFLPAVLPVR
ncbi:MAG: hypothetical protein ACYDDF_09900 [Thermoplasmatota archaeon]